MWHEDGYVNFLVWVLVFAAILLVLLRVAGIVGGLLS